MFFSLVAFSLAGHLAQCLDLLRKFAMPVRLSLRTWNCLQIMAVGQIVRDYGFDPVLEVVIKRKLFALLGPVPAGVKVAFACNHDVFLADVASGGIDFKLHHVGDVTGLGWNPSALMIATSCSDGSIRVWDMMTGRVLWRKRLDFFSGMPTSLAWSPCGKKLAFGL